MPGDTRRAHCARRGAPAGKKAFMQPARRSAGFLLHAGEEKVRERSAELSPIDLLPCGAPNEDSVSLSETGGSGPLGNHPAPKAVPALGIHPASGITSLLVVKLRSISHNASSFQDYRGIHQFSQPKSLAIRSTPRMQQRVSDLSASPRQGVQRESVRLGPNGLLRTHCHDGVVRPGTESCSTRRERAILYTEPLILEMVPFNPERKRRYAPLDRASG